MDAAAEVEVVAVAGATQVLRQVLAVLRDPVGGAEFLQMISSRLTALLSVAAVAAGAAGAAVS